MFGDHIQGAGNSRELIIDHEFLQVVVLQDQKWSIISVQQTTFLDVHYEVWDIYISTVVCPDKVIRCISLDYEGGEWEFII